MTSRRMPTAREKIDGLNSGYRTYSYLKVLYPRLQLLLWRASAPTLPILVLRTPTDLSLCLQPISPCGRKSATTITQSPTSEGAFGSDACSPFPGTNVLVACILVLTKRARLEVIGLCRNPLGFGKFLRAVHGVSRYSCPNRMFRKHDIRMLDTIIR